MGSAAAGSTGILRHLGRLFGSGTAAGLGEAELLDRFARSGDEAAFEALVERHGPMVLGVCRRVLGDSHAADDAFQATFLVLVRRARSIRDPDRLGPWLYGVAQRVARRARAETARRRNRERGGGDMAGIEPSGGLNPARADHPFAAALDEELARLPRAYRDVVVLCDLEDRTHEEAARLLRWPIGTVKGRLQRARERLRNRLQGRGLVLPAAGLAALLGQEAKAVVPAALVEGTVRAATVIAAGGSIAGAGLVSAGAVGLADGALKAMFWTKIKLAAAAVVTTGTVVSASALTYQDGPAGKPGTQSGAAVTQKQTEPPKGQPVTDKVVAQNDHIAQARAKLDKARDALKLREFEEGFRLLGNARSASGLEKVSLKLLKTDVEARPDQEVEAARSHVERMRRVDKRIKELDELVSKSGNVDAVMDRGMSIMRQCVVPAEAELVLARAELWLAQAEAGVEAEGLSEVLNRVDDEMTASEGPPPMRRVGGGVAEPAKASNRSAQTAGPAVPAAASDERNTAILAALDRVVDLNIADGTPLGDALTQLQEQSKSGPLRDGLPIFLDAAGYIEEAKEGGLAEALSQIRALPVQLQLKQVPLKTGLRLLLKQAGLGYIVKEGVVQVGVLESPEFEQEVMGGGAVPGYGSMPPRGMPVQHRAASAEPGGTGKPPVARPFPVPIR